MRILAQPLSLEDFSALPETTAPTEVVDGQLVVNAAPGGPHQLIVGELVAVLHAACPPGHHVVPGPFDWVLRTEPALLVRQPDVLVVAGEQLRGARISRPPLLAIEIISPGSFERDVVVKRAEYARAGLRHYWIVDPEGPGIVVYRAVDGALAEHRRAVGDEVLDVTEPFAVSLRPVDLLPG